MLTFVWITHAIALYWTSSSVRWTPIQFLILRSQEIYTTMTLCSTLGSSSEARHILGLSTSFSPTALYLNAATGKQQFDYRFECLSNLLLSPSIFWLRESIFSSYLTSSFFFCSMRQYACVFFKNFILAPSFIFLIMCSCFHWRTEMLQWLSFYTIVLESYFSSIHGCLMWDASPTDSLLTSQPS